MKGDIDAAIQRIEKRHEETLRKELNRVTELMSKVILGDKLSHSDKAYVTEIFDEKRRSLADELERILRGHSLNYKSEV